MKLVIGAEHRQKPGWVHHDVQDLPGIDIVCDYYELPNKVEAGTCEQIEITHVLEHFPISDIQKTLAVLYGLLADGGELYIEVPNLEWNARELVRNPLSRKNVEYIFGGQRNQWDFHYNGFTPQILIDDLIEAGFKLKELRPNSSIEAWVTK